MHKLTFGIVVFALAGILRASTLIISITNTDTVADDPAAIDLTGVVMTFDNSTGNYTYTFTATAANPFNGSFFLNLNLFDPSADGGIGSFNPDFFGGNTIPSLEAPQTSLTVTGTNPNLEFWKAGDEVAHNSGPFGNPQGISLFRSGVFHGDPQTGVGEGDDLGSLSANDFVVIQPVSEPAAIVLLGGTLLLVGLVGMRRMLECRGRW